MRSPLFVFIFQRELGEPRKEVNVVVVVVVLVLVVVVGVVVTYQ